MALNGLTVDVLGSMTGCYDRCLSAIRKQPGVEIPAELNRKVKDQFAEYLGNYLDYLTFVKEDDTALADFGSYMDGYAE